MNYSCLLGVLPSLMLFTMPLSTADLTQIERNIAKEPAYRSKPKYCLLVFGIEAKAHVWLAQDGDTLYVDRNGNGDLTDPREKIVAETNPGALPEGERPYVFKVGDVGGR